MRDRHTSGNPCSALFTRGETQSLTQFTLGTKLDEKIIDDVLNKGTENSLFIIISPFATGEAKAYRGVGRRRSTWKLGTPCS